jgi:hypothetical protein
MDCYNEPLSGEIGSCVNYENAVEQSHEGELMLGPTSDKEGGGSYFATDV